MPGPGALLQRVRGRARPARAARRVGPEAVAGSRQGKLPGREGEFGVVEVRARVRTVAEARPRRRLLG
ncbi:hypothetical protein FF36_01597 [Frankia torreyi]|uniref:Uncharacterized protein n=1 Tax=Frankia torreyi TaxID=1856 RepID=A0A0D8BJJ2_9ACTN|nr:MULTISPECIES: hypothetical protein [Frankia]KJE24194.1 hypothetical protein FF36_01597 [Frankia torreyi]KQM06111.1 hypothetical protein FF86_1011136 [Frankia sp. CpI1-P]